MATTSDECEKITKKTLQNEQSKQQTHSFCGFYPGQPGYAGTGTVGCIDILWTQEVQLPPPPHFVPALSSSALAGMPTDSITGVVH